MDVDPETCDSNAHLDTALMRAVGASAAAIQTDRMQRPSSEYIMYDDDVDDDDIESVRSWRGTFISASSNSAFRHVTKYDKRLTKKYMASVPAWTARKLAWATLPTPWKHLVRMLRGYGSHQSPTSGASNKSHEQVNALSRRRYSFPNCTL